MTNARTSPDLAKDFNRTLMSWLIQSPPKMTPIEIKFDKLNFKDIFFQMY